MRFSCNSYSKCWTVGYIVSLSQWLVSTLSPLPQSIIPTKPHHIRAMWSEWNYFVGEIWIYIPIQKCLFLGNICAHFIYFCLLSCCVLHCISFVVFSNLLSSKHAIFNWRLYNGSTFAVLGRELWSRRACCHLKADNAFTLGTQGWYSQCWGVLALFQIIHPSPIEMIVVRIGRYSQFSGLASLSWQTTDIKLIIEHFLSSDSHIFRRD